MDELEAANERLGMALSERHRADETATSEERAQCKLLQTQLEVLSLPGCSSATFRVCTGTRFFAGDARRVRCPLRLGSGHLHLNGQSENGEVRLGAKAVRSAGHNGALLVVFGIWAERPTTDECQVWCSNVPTGGAVDRMLCVKS